MQSKNAKLQECKLSYLKYKPLSSYFNKEEKSKNHHLNYRRTSTKTRLSASRHSIKKAKAVKVVFSPKEINRKSYVPSKTKLMPEFSPNCTPKKK